MISLAVVYDEMEFSRRLKEDGRWVGTGRERATQQRKYITPGGSYKGNCPII
jgi:hypothetical protein